MGRARGHITLKDDAHLIPLENGAEFACLGKWTVFLPSLLARKPLKTSHRAFHPHYHRSWFVESGLVLRPTGSDKNHDLNIVVIWWTTSKSTFGRRSTDEHEVQKYLNPSGGWLRNFEFNKSEVAEKRKHKYGMRTSDILQ